MLSAAALIAFGATGSDGGSRGLDVPPHFEPNLGQASAEVRFYGQADGVSAAILVDGAIVSVADDHFRVRFEGASRTGPIGAAGPLPGHSSYFLGRDADLWCSGVPQSTAVRAEDVYRGVDVVYRWQGGDFEYDFIVEPRASPDRIALRFELAAGVSLGDDGDIRLRGSGGDLRIRAPRCWTESARGVVAVDCGFLERDGGSFGFQVGPHDRTATLIIDPRLAYSSYLGGPSGSGAHGVTVDPQGNTFLVGSTGGSDFPVPAPVTLPYAGRGDVMVAKIDPAGSTLLYATYFGGSESDYGTRIEVDAGGDAYVNPLGSVIVSGITQSVDFPLVLPVQATYGGASDITEGDGFVAMMPRLGRRLVFATYLGGSIDEAARGVASDSRGDVAVVGSTKSADFPVVAPYQATRQGLSDAFFLRIACEAPGPVGPSLLAGKAQSGSAILLNWRDIAGAEEFVARTDLVKDGTFSPEFGRAANGVDGLTRPMPPEPLVFLRLAAATLCGEGPL